MFVHWKKRIKYYVLSIMVFLFIIHATNYLLPVAHAQTPTVPSTVYSLPSTVQPTSPLYTDLLVHNMFHTFSCLSIGQSFIGQPCLTYQLAQNAQGAIQGVPVLSSANLSGGLLGTTTGLIAGLYANPPVRTADYLASVGEGLGLVKPAHAQVVGSGEAVLNPILKLWQVSRNISYLVMIIIFVVIGLMVMFRNRINPQTVITAQAALPGLVIGLILITFSYFLAGLISDTAFIGTNLVGYYFTAAQGPTALADPTRLNLVQKISNSNILNIFGSLTGIIESGDVATFSGTVFEALGGEAQKAIRILVFWLSNQFITPLVPDNLSSSPWAALIKPVVGIIGGLATNVAISPLLGQLLSLAAALALIYAMVKLLFKLIMTWLTIIFLTISAPFQFLFASLPGRQGMATGWMLSMLGNILVFPAVIAVIYFVAFLLGPQYTKICPKDATTGNCLIQVSSSNQINNSSFVLPVYAADTNEIIGSNTFPLFGNIDLSFIKILLAFGALMALPVIPDIIVRAVGSAGQTGQMIGQEIMGGARFGQGYAQRTYTGVLGSGQATATGIFGERQIGPYGSYVSKQGLIHWFRPPSYPTPPPVGGGGAPCLPANTLITTPFGTKAIKNISKDDVVWTMDHNGRIKDAYIKQVVKRRVLHNHKILKIVLADGRKLLVSPGHPDALGKDLASLQVGDYLDHSCIITVKLLSYRHKYTYDILPVGETGAYWANNILIGSTLKVKSKKMLVVFPQIINGYFSI